MKVKNIKWYGLGEALDHAGLPYDKGCPQIGTLTKLANATQRSHAKFMRQIMLGFVVEAPLYWWTEFDTYKNGVSRMSNSTMHTLLSKKLDYDDFEIGCSLNFYDELFDRIEWVKKQDNYTDAEKLLVIKKILPSGYKYTSYITMNYEVLRNMYHDRISHRLPEWQVFLKAFEHIPYFDEFIVGTK